MQDKPKALDVGKNSMLQLVAKKTGTVSIKLTHFCNFSIV
jgi:hypothetical protein